jgi:cyclic pyranopterin phosphate synthase
MEKQFTHIDADGKVKMVDVGHKLDSRREAIASARIILPVEVREKLVNNEIHGKKGPVFQTARLAGIMGAKKTHDLIPLCHPLSLNSINVEINVDGGNVEIRCTVACMGKTGVEMEALTGASIAALTVYDMCKALSHDIVIDQVKLIKKTGGKQDYDREA